MKNNELITTLVVIALVSVGFIGAAVYDLDENKVSANMTSVFDSNFNTEGFKYELYTDNNEEVLGFDDAVINITSPTYFKTIIATTPVIQDNKATAVITDEQVSKAIEQASANMENRYDFKKTINIMIPESVGSEETEIRISANSMTKLSEYGASIRMESKTGIILLDSNIVYNISNLSKENDDALRLAIGTESKHNLSAIQQQKVGDSLIVSVKAYVGETYVNNLGGNATVTMNYNLNEGDKPEYVSVYYIDDEGNTTKHDTTYNIDEATVSFTTGHFSHYYVAMEVPTIIGDLPLEAIIVAIILLLIIIAYLVLRNNAHTIKMPSRNTYPKPFIKKGFKPINNLNPRQFRSPTFRPISNLNPKQFRGLSFKPINSMNTKPFVATTSTGSIGTIFAQYSNSVVDADNKSFIMQSGLVLDQNIKQSKIQYKEIKNKKIKINKKAEPFGNMNVKSFVDMNVKPFGNMNVKPFIVQPIGLSSDAKDLIFTSEKIKPLNKNIKTILSRNE